MNVLEKILSDRKKFSCQVKTLGECRLQSSMTGGSFVRRRA